MAKRCSFCKIDELRQNDKRKSCVWTETNTATGQNFKNYDNLVEWNGRMYHIQDSVDVTEYIQLTENAAVDELTGMLSRRTGKEMLGEAIEQARREQAILTVALYDVNELKQVNDKYGHAEGDHLLRYIATVVRENLGPRDMAFRLSGDEFVLAFHDADLADAEKHMQRILKQLKAEQEQSGLFYNMSFSYGLLEVYPGDQYAVSDIISRVDEQMYVQKRNYHIMRAKLALAQSAGQTGEVRDFDYDKEHLYDALSVSTDDYMFVGNMHTGVFRYPPAMVDEFGLPGEVVENAAAFWGKLIHPHDEKGFLESNQEIADGRTDYHNIEYRAKNVKGEWIWLRCRGKMIRDENGEPGLFAGSITNLGKNNQVDHMTGLYNRFEFEGAVKKYMVDRASTKSMGILVLDMDTFKNINDLYNRSFGDEVLRLTAQKISAMLPANAKIYRMDGDEFGIILLNSDMNTCSSIFSRIQHTFRKQQEHSGCKYYCTISGGYASYPQDADNYQDLLKYANYSLEQSKHLGKNRMTVFSAEILEKKERRLELTQLLRESIERGFAGFSIRYQPQVDSRTKVLYGAEALARWHCGKYGDISPAEFIPLLEQSGLIIQMGNWILYHAMAQCREWCKMRADFHMSINLSYLQLLEPDIVSYVQQTLSDFRLRPSNITLELTETHLIKEDEAIHGILDDLRKLGIRIAMDDFGVGYSSLFSLKNTPVDTVKIDRGFVKGVTSDLFNATFIRAITELCHNVGKQVCLEGVETQEEYDAVKNTGLELIQGFYFGQPITSEMFEKKFL